MVNKELEYLKIKYMDLQEKNKILTDVITDLSEGDSIELLKEEYLLDEMAGFLVDKANLSEGSSIEKITDPLTLDEIKQLEILLERELRRIKPAIEQEKIYNKVLEISMIKGKLRTMKRDIGIE